MNNRELTWFNNLINKIKKDEGYYVTISNCEDYTFARITNTHIISGLATSDSSVVEPLRGKISIGPRELGQWWHAPMVLFLPTNDRQVKFILKQLKFWGSEEGLHIFKNEIRSKYIFQYPLADVYGFK